MEERSRRVSPAHILRVWFGLGISSFGGGVATLTLIRRAAVEQEGWITDLEFTEYWALCQLAPGINLFALTILIGRKIGGAPGVAAALTGLLLPSVTITILMTALYARIRGAAATQAALRGVIPATIGLGLVTTIQVVRPLAAIAWKQGWDTLLVYALILVGSGAAVAIWQLPVAAVLAGAGAVGGAHAWLRSRVAPGTAA